MLTMDETSHLDVMKEVKELTQSILKDPFLKDLSPEISLDEVQSRLALEQGRAMIINVHKLDKTSFPVIVLQGATVHDLRKSVENETVRRLKKEGRTTFVSWGYVWKTYSLFYGQQRLTKLDEKLANYGISNNCDIYWKKVVERKNDFKF